MICFAITKKELFTCLTTIPLPLPSDGPENGAPHPVYVRNILGALRPTWYAKFIPQIYWRVSSLAYMKVHFLTILNFNQAARFFGHLVSRKEKKKVFESILPVLFLSGFNWRPPPLIFKMKLSQQPQKVNDRT